MKFKYIFTKPSQAMCSSPQRISCRRSDEICGWFHCSLTAFFAMEDILCHRKELPSFDILFMKKKDQLHYFFWCNHHLSFEGFENFISNCRRPLCVTVVGIRIFILFQGTQEYNPSSKYQLLFKIERSLLDHTVFLPKRVSAHTPTCLRCVTIQDICVLSGEQ